MRITRHAKIRVLVLRRTVTRTRIDLVMITSLSAFDLAFRPTFQKARSDKAYTYCLGEMSLFAGRSLIF